MAQSAAHKHDSTPRTTYQDVLDAPAHRVAEIIDGTLYTYPRPALAHTLAGSALGNDLGNPFQFGRGGPGGWWILDEPDLHLGEDVLVPDLAGWRRERMPELPAPRTSPSRRTGYARCSQARLARSTCTRSVPSTPAKV